MSKKPDAVHIYAPFYRQVMEVTPGGAISYEEYLQNSGSTPAVGADWIIYLGDHGPENLTGRLYALALYNPPSWDIWVSSHVYSSPAIVKSGNWGVLTIGLKQAVRSWLVSSQGLAFTSWPCDRGNLERNGRVRPAFLAHFKIGKLKELLENFRLAPGTSNSLNVELESARQSLEREDIPPAVNKINALVHEVSALKGKKMSGREAEVLIAEAQEALNILR